jgi:hypothetical protein
MWGRTSMANAIHLTLSAYKCAGWPMTHRGLIPVATTLLSGVSLERGGRVPDPPRLTPRAYASVVCRMIHWGGTIRVTWSEAPKSMEGPRYARNR